MLSKLLQSIIILTSSTYARKESKHCSPNIVFIWFDDLGFADTAYNGGSYPTPILDDLAQNDAIKVNFHYAEQVCSASRSALLTGRYSWLSGLNSVTGLNSPGGFNSDLKLFPELLSDEGYKSFIAGKWHVGYQYDTDLPYNRGFDSGIYSKFGPQYYTRGYTRTFSKLDSEWGEPSESIQTDRLETFGEGYIVQIHDTFAIERNDDGDIVETAIYVSDESYSEDVYTEGVKAFIQQQTADDPFFIYYSQFTPHANVVLPPRERPNGDTMDYSSCHQEFDDCSLDNDTRCVFCEQIHYASTNIQEIIDELKENGVYKNTLIIITSDNGAAPTAGTGYAFGEALPYRGVKGGTHEGGIRTPAIIRGGYIERLLKDIGVSECEYNGLLHISDWYHILMDIVDIDDYGIDDDHESLEIWKDIQCECNADCDDDNTMRDELIMMRMCGDADGEFPDDKYFYSGYIRQNDWKLVVNGTNSINDVCPITHIENIRAQSGYQYANGTLLTIPNQTYFDAVYWPQFVDDFDRAQLLYQSECLEALNGTEDINDRKAERFAYNETMLFEISKDLIEACTVGEDSDDNIAKATDLLNYMVDRSEEYNVEPDPDVSIGSFKAQMATFDCNATYTISWNGEFGDATVDEIWSAFIEKGKSCDNIQSTVSQSSHVKYDKQFDLDMQNALPFKDNYAYIVNLIIPGMLAIIAIGVMIGYVCVEMIDRRNAMRYLQSLPTKKDQILHLSDIEMT